MSQQQTPANQRYTTSENQHVDMVVDAPALPRTHTPGSALPFGYCRRSAATKIEFAEEPFPATAAHCSGLRDDFEWPEYRLPLRLPPPPPLVAPKLASPFTSSSLTSSTSSEAEGASSGLDDSPWILSPPIDMPPSPHMSPPSSPAEDCNEQIARLNLNDLPPSPTPKHQAAASMQRPGTPYPGTARRVQFVTPKPAWCRVEKIKGGRVEKSRADNGRRNAVVGPSHHRERKTASVQDAHERFWKAVGSQAGSTGSVSR